MPEITSKEELKIMLYPVLTDSRGLMDLSGIWDFKLDDGNGFEEKWYEKPLEEPMTMAVPSSYNDLKERTSGSTTAGYSTSAPSAFRHI